MFINIRSRFLVILITETLIEYISLPGWGPSRLEGGRATSLHLPDTREIPSLDTPNGSDTATPNATKNNRRNGMFNFLRPNKNRRQSNT